MSTHHQVVIYGASGYTGKLTAWKLAERGIPFIAAGRNAERLQMELDKVPELKGADYQCVEVAHDRKALAGLFAGKKVVINIVGPFMQLGLPVVERWPHRNAVWVLAGRLMLPSWTISPCPGCELPRKRYPTIYIYMFVTVFGLRDPRGAP